MLVSKEGIILSDEEIYQIFDCLFLSTHNFGFLFNNWMVNNIDLFSKVHIASVCIPQLGFDDRMISRSFTGDFLILKKLLRTNHVNLISCTESEQDVENYLRNNLKENRKIVIVLPNLNNEFYSIYIVTPNGKDTVSFPKEKLLLAIKDTKELVEPILNSM